MYTAIDTLPFCCYSVCEFHRLFFCLIFSEINPVAIDTKMFTEVKEKKAYIIKSNLLREMKCVLSLLSHTMKYASCRDGTRTFSIWVLVPTCLVKFPKHFEPPLRILFCCWLPV